MKTYNETNWARKLRPLMGATGMALFAYGALASASGCAPDELGPKCQQYYGTGQCCISAVGDNEVAKAACGTSRNAIEDGIKNGQDAESFEGSCGSAIETAQKQGMCLSEEGKKCHPSGDVCTGCETCDSFCSCQETSTNGQIPAATCLQTCE